MACASPKATVRWEMALPQLPQNTQLQQSIVQHNQEQRGTNTARMPWALTKAEKKQYDQIFRAWDASGSGFITGETALQVFGQSGLEKNDLAKIWYVCLLSLSQK